MKRKRLYLIVCMILIAAMMLACSKDEGNDTTAANEQKAVVRFDKQPGSIQVMEGQSASFEASASGDGNISYEWQYKLKNSSDWTSWQDKVSSLAEVPYDASYDGMEVRCRATDGSTEAFSETATLTYVKEFEIDGDRLVKYNGKSETVTIPAGVKFIGTEAFASNTAIKTVILSDAVELVESLAFKDSSLTTVHIPASVKGIFEDSFDYCGQLENISVDPANAVYDSRNNSNAIIETATNTLIKGGAKTVIPEDVTAIGNKAFANSGLTNITIPASVETIGDNAFSDTKLTEIRIPAYTKSIGKDAFKGVGKVCAIEGTEVEKLVLADYPEQLDHYVPEDGIIIITQPVSAKVNGKKDATFSVVAVGSKLKYQWQYRAPGKTTWKKLDGEKESTVTITYSSQNEGMGIRCKISDNKGHKIITDRVVLHYEGEASIKTQPENVTLDTPSTAYFQVKAEGVGLKYQWQYKNEGASEWKDWSGKTTTTLKVSYDGQKNGMIVRCRIYDDYGTELLSKEAKLVYTKIKLEILKQPENYTVAAGHAASFSVTALGIDMKYQWQYLTEGTTEWRDWEGKTTASINVPYGAKRNGMKLRCKITDKEGTTVTSAEATLTYTSAPVIEKNPVDVTVEKEHAAPFSVSATGEGLTYQWQYKMPNTEDWKDWKGKTTNVMNVAYDEKKDGMSLRCVVTDSNGTSVISQPAVLKYK